jgi:hypothetical protein
MHRNPGAPGIGIPLASDTDLFRLDLQATPTSREVVFQQYVKRIA